MSKAFVCWDIDGTMAKSMLFVPLIKEEHKSGLLSDDVYTDLVASLTAYRDGALPYEVAVQKLLETHAAGLTGKPYDELLMHAREFLRDNGDLFRAFVTPTVALLDDYYPQQIVSAEPQYLATAVAETYGIGDVISTEYKVHDGNITGDIITSLADRSAKRDALEGLEISFAFGDSIGDIEMLRLARHPFCIEPDNELRTIALESGWSIYDTEETIVSDITALLESN